MRALAKTTEGVDPTVPTFATAGLPGVEVASLWGLHAPAGTPLPVRQALGDAFKAAMQEPAIRERLVGLGYKPVNSTPEEHDRLTRETIALWVDVGRRVNLNQ